MSDIITGNEVGTMICEALGLDPKQVTRIILDCAAQEPLAVWVSWLGTNSLLQVDYSSALRDLKIERSTFAGPEVPLQQEEVLDD